jgi:hypothetical protein
MAYCARLTFGHSCAPLTYQRLVRLLANSFVSCGVFVALNGATYRFAELDRVENVLDLLYRGLRKSTRLSVVILWG